MLAEVAAAARTCVRSISGRRPTLTVRNPDGQQFRLSDAPPRSVWPLECEEMFPLMCLMASILLFC
ncbi:hypothetical protein ebA4720 [Aromatoleum aromaticum EbN1]|uniref:Uncharacterized protein n=1 Tax=Aromatoleum aromaticum (strain DSM 19018 / LMG 30748 / EbN1) TaxID=76114 RepID=Q5P1M5_AROAE|nr:hypothetical protein ebA4720 [Aromatoleum aromaticum EbN1]